MQNVRKKNLPAIQKRIQNVVDNPIAAATLNEPAHLLVYISDEAMDFIKNLAIEHGYMQRHLKNKRGLSEFITALADAEFEDARPEEFQAMDSAMLDAEILPEWNMGFTRIRRKLVISPRVQAKLYAIGMEFAIFNPRRSDSTEHSSSIISCLLEAVGCEFLKPIEIRMAPNARS